MNRRWLEEALQMTGLQPSSQFPRDLMGDVEMHLPLSIELIPQLSAQTIRGWLRVRGIEYRVSDGDRTLHGCLVARAGQGVIFVDAGDEEAEQRFTLAHEVAHFALDHMLPRLRAVRTFGEAILPVLNGERLPTPEEMLSSVLERVPLGLQVHLMARGPGGAICAWDVEQSEQRADRLAMELVAPAHQAAAQVRQLVGDIESLVGQEDRAGAHVAAYFGLPADVAGSYVRLLLGRRRPRLSLSEEIFGNK